jgi:hypothetical protein
MERSGINFLIGIITSWSSESISPQNTLPIPALPPKTAAKGINPH